VQGNVQELLNESLGTDSVTENCLDFLKQCLQLDPKARPTAAALRLHPFVRYIFLLLFLANLLSSDLENQTSLGLADTHPGNEQQVIVRLTRRPVRGSYRPNTSLPYPLRKGATHSRRINSR
jgi:serine/threonine protein kinase